MDSRTKSFIREANYINGEWIQIRSDKIAVSNPADANVIGYVPEFGVAEAKEAIAAAQQAFTGWRAKSAKERGLLLMQWAELIDENKQALASLMTLEQGKPLAESLGEMDYANSFIKWFAAEGMRAYGETIPANNAAQRIQVIKQPVGVVATITPWNFPAAMITRKIGPALAAGCTAVIKPDSQTPFSALALAVLAEQAGLPKGVLNIITGDASEIGKEFCTNSIVRKLSFTGSTAVGKILMSQSAATVKKLSLELGGNAPFIVFDDADIDSAIKGLMASKFRNTGQTCVCANRVYVQQSIHDEFVQKLKKAVMDLKVGEGFESDVQQGPLINEKAVEKVERHISDALEKGAKLVVGGARHARGGFYFEPTILTNMNSSMLLAQEETFGPVAGIFVFETDEEVIHAANDTPYGLASYFYSQNPKRIWHVSEALEYGMVGINAGIISTEVAPFGGVKESGVGREGSNYGLDEYLELKYLCWDLS